MSNVYIEAMPEFAFDIRSNRGYTRFTNVRLEPPEGSGIHLVSWRDGFHVKDNVSKPTWGQLLHRPARGRRLQSVHRHLQRDLL